MYIALMLDSNYPDGLTDFKTVDPVAIFLLNLSILYV